MFYLAMGALVFAMQPIHYWPAFTSSLEDWMEPVAYVTAGVPITT